MLPEKPWSWVHVDHAVNFMGTNWLIMIDAYSKYPCIHATSSTSTRATVDLLEEDFSHFGYPHAIVTDNAPTFLSEEFQTWCRERGITHLTGAPYHPATNGAAERLVQTFKQSMRKTSTPSKTELQEFLLQYRSTPLSSGYSPCELLHGRQIRSKQDALSPPPPHVAQGKQARDATKDQLQEKSHLISKVTYLYSVGAPCYALYYGPKRNKKPRWVPAVVTKVLGSRTVNVHIHPKGPTWRRHIDQLRPYGVVEDTDPGETPTLQSGNSTPFSTTLTRNRTLSHTSLSIVPPIPPVKQNYRKPTPMEDSYGPANPRRSARIQQILSMKLQQHNK